MDRSERPPSDSNERRLMPTGGDPPLGVHAVTEFLFCPRAGVITHESQDSDSGQETRPVRLSYLPRYELAEIATMIGRITMFLIGGGVAAFLGIGIFGILALLVAPAFILACWVLLLVVVVGFTVGIWALVVLTYRYEKAKGAKPKEPEFSDDQAAVVDWWGLVAAGFEVRIWPEPLKIPEWKIAGRPWRVLVRGETYIPVFLRNSDRRQLHKQHFARIGAYCELLGRAAAGVSPYGVILYSGSHDAVAIPHSGAAMRALADGVHGMRRLLPMLKGGLQPEPPANENLCHGCHHGVFQKYSELPRRPEDPSPHLRKVGEKKYHCACGDRFDWTPPHESAEALGLIEKEEAIPK